MIVLRLASSIDPDFGQQLAMQISALLSLECSIEPIPLNVELAYDQSRDQYNTRTILENLKQSMPVSTRALLGVVAEDIYLPGLTFVFGAAEVGGRVALISLARLIPTDENDASPLLLQRAYKEAIHELGHVFGLEHCSNSRCVMRFAETVVVVDRRPARFCSDCTHYLAELLEQKK